MNFIKQNQMRNSRINGEQSRIDWIYSLHNKLEEMDEFDFVLNEHAHKLVKRNLTRALRKELESQRTVNESPQVEKFFES